RPGPGFEIGDQRPPDAPPLKGPGHEEGVHLPDAAAILWNAADPAQHVAVVADSHAIEALGIKSLADFRAGGLQVGPRRGRDLSEALQQERGQRVEHWLISRIEIGDLHVYVPRPGRESSQSVQP